MPRYHSLTRSLILRASVPFACVIVILVGGQILMLAAHDEAQYRRQIELLARQGAVHLRDAASPRELLFRQWAWAALQDEHVISVSLTDASGQPVLTIPPLEGFSTALPTVRRGGALAQSITFTERGESRTIWRAAAPLRGPTEEKAAAWIMVLAHHRPWRSVSASGIALLVATVVVVSAFGVGALAAWFNRCVRGPLAAISGLDDALPQTSLMALPVERPDEVGGVARYVSRLSGMLRDSRDKSDRAERSMEWRVADETRQINALLRRAERASWLDPLTQLGNRRLLDDRLEGLVEAQRGEGHDLCVVMLDLDNFKRLNDAKGHAAGDEMLRFVGELLRGSLRPTDLGIRYGGDEFALVLPDTTPGQAARTAERIVRLFRQRTALIDLDVRVSMSAGIASLRRSKSSSGAELLELADRALYAAKTRGRAVLCTRS